MNTKVIFIIAFFAVITGIYGVIDALTPKQETQDIEELSVVNEDIQYITLWRAKKDLIKGTPISINQLQREQVVLNDAIQLGIKKDVTLDFTITTLLNSNIKQGELVLPEHQLMKSQIGYIDLLIDDGMTIYPLQITTNNLIENFIKPGDYIDIMAVSSPVNNLAESGEISNSFRGVNASLFMKKIKVINIDYQAQPADSDSNNQKEADVFTTVVIEIPPQQLARIALAQRSMHIEIYRTYDYKQPLKAEMRDVISNYSDILEMRGSDSDNEGVY